MQNPIVQSLIQSGSGKLIDSLPVSVAYPPPPWGSTLLAVQRQIELTGDHSTDAQLLMLEGHLLIAWHWVFRKKWESQHKIPIDRVTAKSFEPLGDWWLSILELCLQLHPVYGNSSCYKDAGQWFASIVGEFKASDRAAILGNTSTGKTGYVRQQREIIALLARGLNPCNKSTEPHYWRLIESAIRHADRSDQFRAQYWAGRSGLYKAFLPAYRRWIKTLESDPQWGWTERSALGILKQSGQGKQKKFLERRF